MRESESPPSAALPLVRSERSPFATRDFSAAVARARGGIRVLERHDRHGLAVEWAIQIRRRGIAEPVGFGMADVQGPVVRPGVRFDPAAMLRRAGLALYDFDHLSDPSGSFARWYSSSRLSPTIDLRGGMGAYVEVLRRRGSGLPKRVVSLTRRLERDLGPVALHHDTGCKDDLAVTIDRKRAQYIRTDRQDALAQGWKRALLEELLLNGTADCHLVTGRLLAGDTTVAWHVGLRGTVTLHYWFPVHDPKFSAYSPGLLLLWRMLEAEATRGTTEVDLGTGDAPYKARLATGAHQLFTGNVRAVPGAMPVRRALVRLTKGLA